MPVIVDDQGATATDATGAGWNVRFANTRRMDRVGWLRAAVLGADDGIISTASLLVGVDAAAFDTAVLLTAGLAGLVAGAASMAAGEYVSVSSQRDTERAELARTRRALAAHPASQLRALTAVYVSRGLSPALAADVARQLTVTDAIGAHARDQLGFSVALTARPMQAALASAASFVAGASLPLFTAAVAPAPAIGPTVAGVSLVGLAALGAVSASLGGAPLFKAALRVTCLGALAFFITAAAGALVGMAH